MSRTLLADSSPAPAVPGGLLADLPSLIRPPKHRFAFLDATAERLAKAQRPDPQTALPLLRQAGASEAMLTAWGRSDDETVKDGCAPHLLWLLDQASGRDVLGDPAHRITVDDGIGYFLTFVWATSVEEAQAWMRRTRHGWAFIAAGLPMAEVRAAVQAGQPWTFEALTVLAGLHGRRMPPLTTGPLTQPD